MHWLKGIFSGTKCDRDGALMASSSRSRLSAVQISGTILVALLLFTSPVIKASERDVEPDGRHWSEWEALGSGFVARRRVPSRIKLPTQQRRLPTTQARGEWKAENDSILREDTVFLDSDYSPKAGPKVEALWLRTRAAGLYSVSVQFICW